MLESATDRQAPKHLVEAPNSDLSANKTGFIATLK